jgi:predicted secreted protein
MLNTNSQIFPLSLLLCLCLISPQSILRAEEQEQHYDRIELHSTASAEVENDTLIAVLYAQKEGDEPVQLSNSVNQLISQAVKEAKGREGIKVQTLGYQTTPIYQQKRLTGWRVRQSIRLQSMHSDRLSDLLKKLQSSLALDSLSYTVSPAQREKVEESLTLQAIDSFRKRADLVTKQFGRKEYRLVEMKIESPDRATQPFSRRTRMMAMGGAAESAPTIEAGSQTVWIEITGTIELQIPQ